MERDTLTHADAKGGQEGEDLVHAEVHDGSRGDNRVGRVARNRVGQLERLGHQVLRYTVFNITEPQSRIVGRKESTTK